MSNAPTSSAAPAPSDPAAAPAPAAAALFVDDGGTSRPNQVPVVLLHSSGGDTTHFTAQLAHLRASRRALAVDLPGHGQSPPAESYEVQEVADVVLRTLSARGVDHFVVVGHSWGGAVALAIAASAPRRVDGLFLLDPASDASRMPKAEADGLMESLRQSYDAVLDGYWASMLDQARPEVRERLMREIKAEPRANVVGTLASLLTFDPLPALKAYRGARRTLITRFNDRPDGYHRLVADLPVTRLDGTGHWLQLDKPDEVNAALDDFLTSVDPH